VGGAVPQPTVVKKSHLLQHIHTLFEDEKNPKAPPPSTNAKICSNNFVAKITENTYDLTFT